MKKSNLEEKLIELNTKINSLMQERALIQQQLIQDANKEVIDKITKWNLSKDKCIVMFSKDHLPCNYLHIFDHLHIDDSTMRVSCIHSLYSEIEYELTYKLYNDQISYLTLIEYQEQYNLYIVHKEYFKLLQEDLYKLKFSPKYFEQLIIEYVTK